MRGEWFEFKPQFKLWLRTNHKPVIRGTDPASGTGRADPLHRTLRGGAGEALQTVGAELPAFTWAVQGCLSWQMHGLGLPEVVEQATAAYRAEMDMLAVSSRNYRAVARRDCAPRGTLRPLSALM